MVKRACKFSVIVVSFLLFTGLSSQAIIGFAWAQEGRRVLEAEIEPIVLEANSQEMDDELDPDLLEGEETGKLEADANPLDYSTRSIDQIDLSLTPKYSTPKLRPIPTTGANVTGPTTVKAYTWTAPNDTYKNLIFEEPLLERHGITRNERWQPVFSGLHFFKAGLLSPLGVVKGYHHRCDNPLGWGTPGSYCR